MEDYAEDREADIQRVQQMLENVDEPDTPKGRIYNHLGDNVILVICAENE